ncbi:MAG: glycosyltransferase family 39 protein [bacterium]|nr:glycosyltransferase family 39 protein [bacterium]
MPSFYVHFLGDWRVSAVLGVLTLLFFFSYPSLIALKRGRFMFWLGTGCIVFGFALTIGISSLRLPRGLTGTYYDRAGVSGKAVQSLRYFETPGQRVDRFLDFDPNDFNNRYPFSGNSFSVQWEGYVYLPESVSSLGVESNFATALSLDDILIQTPPSTIDLGTPEARAFLGTGWSFDEQQEHKESITTFSWSSGSYSDIYLGVDEVTDYQVSFRGLAYQYPGSPEQQITVSVNGMRLETLTLKKTWNWETYSVHVPQHVVQEAGIGTVWVRLNYSNPVRPIDVVEESAERRKIAVALDSVSIEKTSGNTGTSPKNHHQDVFSPGFHRIKLQAHSDGKDPFLRLTWKRAGRSQSFPIPEDYLFPQHADITRVKQVFFRERSLLGLSLVYKWIVVFLLTALLVVGYIFPQLRHFQWKRYLTRPTFLLAGMLLFGFLVRLLFIFEMRTLDPGFFVLPDGTDHLSYWFFARGFFRGYWPNLTHEAFFQAPLVSLYFIVCSMLFGEGVTITRIVTAMLSTCSLFFVFLITQRVFNNTAAYIAVLLCACNGILIFYDTSLLFAPLIVFLNLAAVWLMYTLQERLSWRATILLGIVIGLTGLARANIVLLMPCLLLWMLFWFPGTLWRRILHYACIGVVVILTIMPVSIRNYYADHHSQWVWTNSNGGVTFWIGNNPSANGMFGYSAPLLQDTRKRMKKGGTSYRDEVFQYVKEHTRDYLKLEYNKFKMFWRGYEIGNNIPYYIFRQQSYILGLPWINFVLLGPLGIVGMILAGKRWKEGFILYGFVGVQLVTTLLFFALARYRLPAVPVLSMFAAYTIWHAGQLFKQRKWPTLLLIFGSVAIFYILLNYPYAAFQYQKHYGESMPLIKVLRYWDLFHLP